jgi:hypothetical protein
MMEMNWCVYLEKCAQRWCLIGKIGQNCPIFTRLSGTITVLTVRLKEAILIQSPIEFFQWGGLLSSCISNLMQTYSVARDKNVTHFSNHTLKALDDAFACS